MIIVLKLSYLLVLDVQLEAKHFAKGVIPPSETTATSGRHIDNKKAEEGALQVCISTIQFFAFHYFVQVGCCD
jgi:hypothetical protein